MQAPYTHQIYRTDRGKVNFPRFFARNQLLIEGNGRRTGGKAQNAVGFLRYYGFKEVGGKAGRLFFCGSFQNFRHLNLLINYHFMGRFPLLQIKHADLVAFRKGSQRAVTVENINDGL